MRASLYTQTNHRAPPHQWQCWFRLESYLLQLHLAGLYSTEKIWRWWWHPTKLLDAQMALLTEGVGIFSWESTACLQSTCVAPSGHMSILRRLNLHPVPLREDHPITFRSIVVAWIFPSGNGYSFLFFPLHGPQCWTFTSPRCCGFCLIWS